MKPNKIRVAHYDGKSLFYPHRSLLFCDRIASLLVSQRLLVMLLQLFLFLSGPKFEQHYMVQSFTYTTTGSSFHSTKKWNTLVIPHRNMMGDTKLDQEGKEEDAGNNQGNKIDNSTVEQSMYPDVIPVSGMKVNDGGSNLTDRFKYKVNALMGVFDPTDNDTEHRMGNIMNAMLSFPVSYTFHVVGRTNDDDLVRNKFVEQVKSVVETTIGNKTNDNETKYSILPRGSKFTKITIQAEVESAEVIALVYDRLAQVELCMMQF